MFEHRVVVRPRSIRHVMRVKCPHHWNESLSIRALGPLYPRRPHSHSMVPGGFDVTS
jgi:hypothetical protein